MGSILTISKENQYGARLRLLIRWTVQVYRQERWFSGAMVFGGGGWRFDLVYIVLHDLLDIVV
jgi:hypothetical protein